MHVIKIAWASFFKQEQKVIVFQGGKICFEFLRPEKFLILYAKRKQNAELSSFPDNLQNLKAKITWFLKSFKS